MTLASGSILWSLALVTGIVALQTLAGAAMWLIARRTVVSLGEVLGMGFALGTVLATLGSQLTLLLFRASWGWGFLVLAGLVIWVGAKFGAWRLGTIAAPRLRGGLVLLPALIVGVVALVPSFLVTPLRNGYVVGESYQPDLVFFEALAQSVSSWGASDNSMLVGEPIRYHWLSYGWIGGLSSASGVSDFVVMTRVFPLLMLLAAVLLAASWARLLSGVWWVPGLSALLVVAGGYVGASQGVALTFDSPSTAYAVVLGLAFGLTLSLILQVPGGRQIPLLVVMGLLAFALVGAKASQALVIAVGVAFIAVWAVLSRSIHRVWPLVLASGSGMVLGYLAFLFGLASDDTNIGVSGTQEHASTFQGLDPFAGGLGIALGTAALILAVLPRWVGATWIRRTLPGEFAFGLGLAVAGVGTLVALRSGTNSAWFALGSTALISVLAAVGIGIALSQIGYRWGTYRWYRDPIVWAGLAAVAINAVVLLAYALAVVSGAPVLWRGPLIAWVLIFLVGLALARKSGLQGGAWIRWVALVTVVASLTSVGARANGSIVWGLAHSRATPIVQDFIRLVDPDAEFTTREDYFLRGTHRGLRTATASLPRGDQRGETDAVARRGSIIQWTPSRNQAALLLREMSEPDAVVAVSRPNLQPFLPIVSERRAWVAGLPYSTGYTTEEGVKAADFRTASLADFLTQPSAARYAVLQDAGVGWLWITPESFGSLPLLDPWAEEVFIDKDVALLRLIDSGANSS